ncbi:uncharacterized protein A4U43_C02F19310 [Asparagus officinalis]|uniref:SUZ domain-containing protein n=1 Tax=Asparagus officinalis TaxID=4686 RepID=A0A5P1FPC3_ASPOF|nr:uncharacterized protein LOC109831676 isoform X1 [Asparagus officinalis]XP_020254644.1 uncharacterized protein LOC109831676 isoform X2 [Asparagus officinalis]ONK78490.1 uncharacterized protein A4U43_C02F19310 [Asparagus officinalis]
MESHVDPFLVEALENPRHRLTVLRMELDIQKFVRNPNQHQFEFHHLPTSYLRCAAHRVAQHYGLQTFSLDNTIDSLGTLGSKILAIKTPGSKFPTVCLSEIPAKQTENKVTEQLKIAIRQRPSKTSLSDRTELENRKNSMRTVEERKEEYEKARARIFNSPISREEGCSMTSSDELECSVRTFGESEKAHDAASKVAILRDQEKDRFDPDYDRSYNRYVRGLTTTQNSALCLCNVTQPPLVQYEACPQIGHLLRNHNPISYAPSNTAVTAPCAFGCNYMQWPCPTMMYAQSYGHFRHAMPQAPAYQQSLSFEHTPHCYR